MSSIILIYGDRNSARYPAYHRLDLRGSYKIVNPTWSVEFYFEILNAYNRGNVIGISYNDDYTKSTYYTSLPIVPYFGVKFDF